MKFVRLSDYTPKRSKEVVEALAFYTQLRNLKTELKIALSESGRIVTSTINLLQIKIAQSSADVAEKEKLLSYRMGDELLEIRKQFPDINERKQAIENWFNKPSGYKDALWMQLDEYGKTLKNYVKSKYNVSADAAEEAVHAAMTFVMAGEDKSGFSPIISTLSSYDPSHGTLAFDYIKQKLNFSTRTFLEQYFKIQKTEKSMNQTVGDADGTEMGDLIAAPSQSDDYDIKSYSEVSDELIAAFKKQINELVLENANPNISPAKKELNKNLLLSYAKKDNLVRVHLVNLRKLGDNIDEYEMDISYDNKKIRELTNSLLEGGNDLDSNSVENVKANIAKIKANIQQLKAKKSQAVDMFTQIRFELQDMIQIDNDGNVIVEPSVENLEKQKTKKINPNKEFVTQQNLDIIKQNQEPIRERLYPWLVKSTNFSNQHGVRNENSLFNNSFVSKIIKTPEAFNALVTQNYDGLDDSQKASSVYVTIVMKALLELRDIQVINKKYDTIEMTEGKNPKDWFVKTVLERINSNEILNSINPSYKKSIENAFVDFMSSADGFRSMYLKIDSWTRGAAYNEKKEELFPGKEWGDLTPEERKSIAEDVYKEQYETGVRRFYLANPDKILQHGARIPIPSTHEGEYYINQMTGEVERISSDKGNKNWFATEKNPERLMFKSKIKQKNSNTPTFKGVVAPVYETDDSSFGGDGEESTLAYTIDSLIKIANAYDSLGMHKKADSITSQIKKIRYG
jgi:hypothetical protein